MRNAKATVAAPDGEKIVKIRIKTYLRMGCLLNISDLIDKGKVWGRLRKEGGPGRYI
jgi:hypothetical protein